MKEKRGGDVGPKSTVAESPLSQQVLEQYLMEKGLQHLLVRIVEKLLVDRPENPIDYLVGYLFETYPEQTSRFRPSTLAVESARWGGSHESLLSESGADFSMRAGSSNRLRRDLDSSMISEPDLTVDEMLPAQPAVLERGTLFAQRRGSVSAAPWTEGDSFALTAIHEKSQDDRVAIETLLPKYWVTASLDLEDTQRVVDAMEVVAFKEFDAITTPEKEQNSFYYVVKSGVCYVRQDGKVMRELVEGDGFGELTLFYNTPQMESVFAASDVVMFRLDSHSFRSIIVRSALERRKQHLQVVSSVPLFQSLSEKSLCALSDAMQARTYAPGSDVVVQNDSGSEFFVIEKGKAEVLHDGERVGTLEAGDYFGEIALLDPKGVRAATVRVMEGGEPLKVAYCRREVFHRVLGDVLAEDMKKKIRHYKRTPKRVAGKSLDRKGLQ